MSKPRLATCSLAGCFGCHMSILDIDERILQLAEVVQFHKSPITDIKTFTERCRIGLVEGGCANEENVEVLRAFRTHCDILVSMGYCATSGGIPAMRNLVSMEECLREAYMEGPSVHNPTGGVPGDIELPLLLDKVRPCARGRQDGLFPARLPAVGRHDLGRGHRWSPMPPSSLPYRS